MRTGQNPAKFANGQIAYTSRITIALLTYIPHLQGYYANSLDVLKASINSIEKNTKRPYDLLVFDNGSGTETQTYLQTLHASDRVQFLFNSSRNIGKGKAWELIFSVAPGEVIAYADGDVLFESGWLEGAMELLESYPDVGMVSCRPMRTYEEGHTATQSWAEQDPDALLEEGHFIDWETFREHDVNLGIEENEVLARFKESRDLRVTYHGVQALIGAGHWQFVAYKKTIQSCLPLGIDRPLGDDRKLDEAINQAGYLRLMTTKPFVRHLGNRLPADPLGTGVAAPYNRPGGPSLFRILLDLPFLKRLLLGIYNRIFQWYFYR